MLEEFLNDPNFPQQTVNIYSFTEGIDPLTGIPSTTYALKETKDVWILPQSVAKRYFTDKVVDELTNLMITDKALKSTDIVQYGATWYQCKISDDIFFSSEVVQIGLIKIAKPNNVSGEVGSYDVLGDVFGAI